MKSATILSNLLIAMLLLCTLNAYPQKITETFWGKNSLSGRLFVKDLREPVTGEIQHNCLILKLPAKIHFKRRVGYREDGDATVDEIRLYGTDSMTANQVFEKYRTFLGKDVIIEGDIFFALSNRFPFLANVREFTLTQTP